MTTFHRPTHGGNIAWAASLVDCPVQQIVDFSASINPLGPSPRVISAIQAQLQEISQYPSPDYGPLRQAIGRFHGIDPAGIMPGNGAAELLTWAGRALAQLPLTVLPTPAFNDYDRALQASGAQVERRALIDIHGNMTPIADVLADLPAGVGLLCNNPHNPTGQIFDPEILPDLLDRLALVVVDESFMDFVRPALTALPLVEYYPNLVVLRSLTKFFSLPGLRLGYAVGHPDLLRRWQAWRDPWAVNSLAAAAGVAALGDREFITASYRWYEEAQPELYRGLSANPRFQVYPSAANFFLLRRSTGDFPHLQRQLLQQHHILIRDCLSFPELGAAYGRLAVKSPADNQSLLQALGELG